MDDDDDRQRLREHRQDFLREWQIGVLPLDESLLALNQGAIEFGQAALKAAFLLNGGALVVFPAFATVFGVTDKTDLISAALVFVLALALTWLATACAYFTMVYQGLSTLKRREAGAKRLENSYYPPKQGSKPAGEKSPEDLEKESRGDGGDGIVSEVFRWFANVLSFGSFVAFVKGSKPAGEKSPEDLEKESRRRGIVSEVFRWSAIVLSFGSFVTFVIGIYFGWNAIFPTIT